MEAGSMDTDRQADEQQAEVKEQTSGKNSPTAYRFPTVFASELEEIRERREKANYDLNGLDESWSKEKGLSKKDKDALSESLVGLALSGGGIRSATFCL